MKVSIALHTGEIDPRGNQRQLECAYQNYNRCYADLMIDPVTGNGNAGFNVTFPTSGESFGAYFFSIGTCIAPQDLGGSVIVFGPITGGLSGHAGTTPNLDAGVMVEKQRLLDMDLIVYDPIQNEWREKTEGELKITYPRAA